MNYIYERMLVLIALLISATASAVSLRVTDPDGVTHAHNLGGEYSVITDLGNGRRIEARTDSTENGFQSWIRTVENGNVLNEQVHFGPYAGDWRILLDEATGQHYLEEIAPRSEITQQISYPHLLLARSDLSFWESWRNAAQQARPFLSIQLPAQYPADDQGPLTPH